MDPLTTAIVSAVVSGLVASLGTIAAIRVELRWLRRDVDNLNKKVFSLSNSIKGDFS